MEQPNKKVSIFEDSFNPQSAICLTTVYSRIIQMCKQGTVTFQKIIIGIAFNEPILFKIIMFVDKYCGVENLLP